MGTPTPPDFSDLEGYGSGLSSDSDGSFENMTNTENSVRASITSYPGRTTGPFPVPAVGFGRSRYGIHPRDIRVANTGPSAENGHTYRTDQEPLIRWDGRGPEVIFGEGFQPHNNLAPSSFQYAQSNLTDTAFVSFSRSSDPRDSKPDWLDEKISYRYSAPSVPGGIDLVTSMPEVAYLNQQEVVFWKGMRPEHIAAVDAFSESDRQHQSGRLTGSLVNPYAGVQARTAQERLDQQSAPERVTEASLRARTRQATEYDLFRQQYAEWHAWFGQHTQHAQLDGNLRSYAEQWASQSYEDAARRGARWNTYRAWNWSESAPRPPSETHALYAQAPSVNDARPGPPGPYAVPQPLLAQPAGVFAPPQQPYGGYGPGAGTGTGTGTGTGQQQYWPAHQSSFGPPAGPSRSGGAR